MRGLRNGSRKTTLLNLIEGIVVLQEGTVEMNGTGVTSLSDGQRRNFRVTGMSRRRLQVVGRLILFAAIGLFPAPVLAQDSHYWTEQIGNRAPLAASD